MHQVGCVIRDDGNPPAADDRRNAARDEDREAVRAERAAERRDFGQRIVNQAGHAVEVHT